MIKLRMSAFPFKKNKTNIFLAVDIGSEAVKTLLFNKEEGKISILGSSIWYYDQIREFGGQNFEEDVIKKAILKTIEESQKRKGSDKKPAGAFLGINANILEGKISAEVYKRKKEKEKITEEEEREIYQAVLKSVRQKIAKLYSETSGILPEDIDFLSLKIIETKIDGYSIPKISGFPGKEIEFKILAVFSPKYYLESIKAVFKEAGIEILGISHLSETLSFIFKTENPDGIFLDVGGQVTQIIQVKRGILEKISKFDVGGEDFSQALSQVFGISKEQSRLLKERYSENDLPKNMGEGIREVILKYLQRWFGNLKISLFEEKTFIPKKIFLLGGASQLPEIGEILKEGDWSSVSGVFPKGSLISALSLGAVPEVKSILPKDISPNMDIPEKLNNSQFTSVFLLLI
ncbi:MAG: hypothetical protein PHF44_03675 [Candidatus Pacebacteria bacterium]|nr:hypothetical protein [Candidatus Paceibacterota bacterium]